MAYTEVLQTLNDEIYPAHISIQKSLINIAIYKIYGTKWWGLPHDTYVLNQTLHLKRFLIIRNMTRLNVLALHLKSILGETFK